MKNRLSNTLKLPVDIVLSPEWWYHNEKITFDQDFFFHPVKRVEIEKRKETVLYERWGQFGLGQDRNKNRPEIGAVHLAAGYILSEMLGCDVKYTESHPPQVISANINHLHVDEEKAFTSDVFKKIIKLWESLKTTHSYLTGDINWGGILNLAIDLRGETLFTDMMMVPDKVKRFFTEIASVIIKFTSLIEKETSTTSVSVNRLVRKFQKPLFLHSECTHTMISEEDYENFLLPFDIEWSKQNRPFGIHYCGNDPHRMASAFSKIPHLDFLDVGWGGNLKALRNILPETFLNIRLSPVEIIHQTEAEIRESIIKRVKDSEIPELTGICCINIDEKVSDEKINVIFQTVEELRKETAG